MSVSDDAFELDGDAAWLAAAIVLVASLGGAVVLAEWPLWGVTPDEPEDPNLVEPTDGGTKLWPTRPVHSTTRVERSVLTWSFTATRTRSTPP